MKGEAWGGWVAQVVGWVARGEWEEEGEGREEGGWEGWGARPLVAMVGV